MAEDKYNTQDPTTDEQNSDEGPEVSTNAGFVGDKEWKTNEYVLDEEGVRKFAAWWPRALMENAQDTPQQPLLVGFKDTEEVTIEFDRLFKHVLYTGSAGSGWTTAMMRDAMALMYAGHGICVIDTKGDITDGILRQLPRERWDDVIYIAPGDENLDSTVGFNLFQTYHEPGEPGFDEEIEGIVDDFKELIAAGEYWGPRMDRIMKTMVRGMIRHPREFTPIEMYYALLKEENRQDIGL